MNKTKQQLHVIFIESLGCGTFVTMRPFESETERLGISPLQFAAAHYNAMCTSHTTVQNKF